MPSRGFVGPDGVQWSVWSTIPSLAERRRLARRKPTATGARDRGTIAERRRGRERRRVAESRAAVSSGFEQGWLTFESDLEKRRLVPIPEGWEVLSDAALAALCARATPVAKWRGRLIE